MKDRYDFVVVGAGSAGAVVAARLSEDPDCTVALIEAGDRPPIRAQMPALVGTLQNDPETDWMFTADPGNAGLGLRDGLMMVPRGKMLGGSSSLNYMAYVRGHPGDYDAWAAQGADGWSYDELLPYFLKSEDLVPSNDIVVDAQAHGTDGPLAVSVRTPVLPAAQGFVAAAEAAGIPRGDYNGSDRLRPEGVASLFQTTTRNGKRASTYQAFLEGNAEDRPNLTILSGSVVLKVNLSGSGEDLKATGVDIRASDGTASTVEATREVILSAGAIGTPQILMVSGIGPRRELEQADVACRHELPYVGKHLKDHLHVGLLFDAPGLGTPVSEVGISAGPDALRAPAGPLPADPADDVDLPEELLALKAEAERRVVAWAETGEGLVSSSLYDAVAFTSTGLGDAHTHDAQIACLCAGFSPDTESLFRVDTSLYFDDPAAGVDPTREAMVILANPVQPRSSGELVLAGPDPLAPPEIRMNYFSDPHDLKVMVAVLRRALEIIDKWPGEPRPGQLQIPPFLAAKHGYLPGEPPSDALLENLALHFSTTVYHLACTCRIGDVVDPSLRVLGVANLRIADASVMPELISGNTNAPTIMIGEKAAEMVARDHGTKLANFVG